MSGTDVISWPASPPAPADTHRRTVFVLLLLAFLGFSGALEGVVGSGPLGSVQEQVTAYLDSSEKKAVEAFAVARGINAIISVLKSVDLSAVVAQGAPLEVLEPVDDLAKQFSDVMVVSIVSILLQRLILAVSQAWALSVLLPIGCVLLALSYRSTRSTTLPMRLAAVGRSVIMLALFARFAVLAAGLAGTTLTDRFLADDLNASLKVIQAADGNLNGLRAQAMPSAPTQQADDVPPGSGVSNGPTGLAWLGNALRGAINNGSTYVHAASGWLNPAALSAMVADLPEKIVRAIAIFVVQTLLTPLAVAFVFYTALRAVLRPMATNRQSRLLELPPTMLPLLEALSGHAPLKLRTSALGESNNS